MSHRRYPDGFPSPMGSTRIFPSLLKKSDTPKVYCILYEEEEMVLRTTDLYEIRLHYTDLNRHLGTSNPDKLAPFFMQFTTKDAIKLSEGIYGKKPSQSA